MRDGTGDTFGAMSVSDPDTGMHSIYGGAVAPQLFADRPPVDDADADGALERFDALRSLELSHNVVAEVCVDLAPTLVHLNLSHNRLEHVGRVSHLTQLVELDLGFNVLCAVEGLEGLHALQVPREARREVRHAQAVLEALVDGAGEDPGACA